MNFSKHDRPPLVITYLHQPTHTVCNGQVIYRLIQINDLHEVCNSFSLRAVFNSRFSINFYSRKYEGNIEEAVEHEERLCDEVKTEGELTHLGDMVWVGGRCKAAVTAKTGFWRVEF